MKISDRKKIEESLLEIKQRFNDFTESALELIWEFDAEGRYIVPMQGDQAVVTDLPHGLSLLFFK